MNPSEELEDLIRELAYQDHANGTDFSEQITEVFLNATESNKLNAKDIQDDLESLQLIEQIKDDEQLVVIHRVLQRLPIVISELKLAK